MFQWLSSLLERIDGVKDLLKDGLARLVLLPASKSCSLVHCPSDVIASDELINGVPDRSLSGLSAAMVVGCF
jgi:hypothetical protein